MSIKLDAIDLRILNTLQRNGRLLNIELAVGNTSVSPFRTIRIASSASRRF